MHRPGIHISKYIITVVYVGYILCYYFQFKKNKHWSGIHIYLNRAYIITVVYV